MDSIIVIALSISLCVTIAGFFMKTTKEMIFILFFQAMVIGIAEILLEFMHAQSSGEMDWLFSVGMDWLFSVTITPVIFYYGMVRTENKRDPPIISSRWGAFLLIAIASVLFGIGIWIAPFFPRKLEVLPIILLLSTVSTILAFKGRDYLKVLIGINMVENSILLSMVGGQTYLATLFLVFMVLIDLICVYACKVYYRDNGGLSIRKTGGS